MKKFLTGSSCALVAVFLLLATAGSPRAQESGAGLEKAQGEGAETKPVRAEQRGRLPDFYRAVVTPQQKEEIYTIQQSYSGQLAELQKQIAELEAKRDAEIAALLSPEQLAKVKMLRDEAQKRRDARAAERRAAAADPTPPTQPPAK